jgi:hypothetical protein
VRGHSLQVEYNLKSSSQRNPQARAPEPKNPQAPESSKAPAASNPIGQLRPSMSVCSSRVQGVCASKACVRARAHGLASWLQCGPCVLVRDRFLFPMCTTLTYGTMATDRASAPARQHPRQARPSRHDQDSIFDRWNLEQHPRTSNSREPILQLSATAS